MGCVILTGGLCAGKSTCSLIAQKLGYAVIDSDAINRELLQDKMILNDLEQKMHLDLLALSTDDLLKKFREVLLIPSQRLLLESYLRPLIEHIMLERMTAALKVEPVLLVISVFKPSGIAMLAHAQRWTIECAMDKQIQRIKERYSCSDEEAWQRCFLQGHPHDRMTWAQKVLWNNGDKQEFEQICAQALCHKKC
jgi:dephospho-CoA kinase